MNNESLPEFLRRVLREIALPGILLVTGLIVVVSLFVLSVNTLMVIATYTNHWADTTIENIKEK